MNRHPVVLVVVTSLLIPACDRGGDESTLGAKSSVSEHPAVLDSEPAKPANAPANEAPLLQVSPGSPSFLVDAAGASVYFLQDNRDGSRCNADCEQAWPPVLSQGGSAPPVSGINAGLLGTLQRADGAHQVTYAGQPLHRYAGDNGAGRTSGHEVRDKWGYWRLITPLGEPLAGQPASEPNPTQPSQPAPQGNGETDAPGD